jgi:sensor histidine kinase YesM
VKPWQYILVGFVLIVLVAGIMTSYAGEFASYKEQAENLVFIVFICGATWGGCYLIGRFICTPTLMRKQSPVMQLIISYVIAGTYAIVLMISSFKLWELIDPDIRIPYSNYVTYSVFSLLITLLVSSIYAISDYMKQWKQSELKAEQMKQQMLKSEYESLKNQVNPHFLFNSLNTLTALISEDQEKAIDFVQKLSKVFRYALQNQEKTTIDLASEVDIVNSYLFLQKMRFGDNLRFHIDIPPNVNNAQVITQGLLMLVENAIKHNEASGENPLHIQISMEGKDYVVVKNNLKRKNMAQPSTGIGLPNIVSRYQSLTDKPVVIQEDENEFIVKIPIINSLNPL